MVTKSSSVDSPDSTTPGPHGIKRKADEGSPPAETSPAAGQRHTRSKRNRYISIACNECKRRKIKCNGQTPCQRCGNLNLDCIYAPNCCTNTLKDSAEFQQLKQTLAVVQEQVQDLYARLAELQAAPPLPPPGAGFSGPDLGYSVDGHHLVHPHAHDPHRPQSVGSAANTLPPLLSPKPRASQRVLPAFCGPTSSTYGINVAKSTLQTMGITNNPALDEGHNSSRDPSRVPSPTAMLSSRGQPGQKDPLWALELSDVKRLLDVFEEEIGITYPVCPIDKLTKHALTLCKFIDASRRQGFRPQSLPGADALDDDDTTVLRLVLACTLALEGGGHSELGQRLFESAKPAVDLKLVTTTGLVSVVQLVLTATYYFQTDEETQAWRFIGIAARVCIEMGLHRRDSLLKTFNNEAEFRLAVRIFWTVYALDRRWSFGTGMPFALQDADIDPGLPEPDDMYPYLKHITRYNQIAAKVWYHNVAYESGLTPTKKDEIGFLDYQIVSWYQDLPPELQFNSRDLQRESEIPGRGRRRLRMLMHLRKNQARISIYRPILHSATSIMENRHHAQQVVDVAKETITTLTGMSQISDIYRTQQIMYHYFLVQALAVLFLAVAHAPAVYCSRTRQEFYAAIELIKGFSTKSHVSRRLWRMTRGLKEMADKIGMLARNGHGGGGGGSSSNGDGSHSNGSRNGDTTGDADADPHSDAAATMVGMAGGAGGGSGGHGVGAYPALTTSGTMDPILLSPDNALQMTNELSNLFEMAGNFGSFDDPGGPDVYGPSFGISSAGHTTGHTGHTSGHTSGHTASMEMAVAPFQNEPEFSRILNELF